MQVNIKQNFFISVWIKFKDNLLGELQERLEI